MARLQGNDAYLNELHRREAGPRRQSEERLASQANSSQVFQYHKKVLHFHHDRLVKEDSDTMLVAGTGYADGFWRQSAWYLNILADLQPKPVPGNMEKM